MNVIGVASEDIGRISDKLAPFLLRMEAEGRSPAVEILAELQDGRKQCWLIVDGTTIKAVAITRIYELSRKICEIAHLAGDDLPEWESAIEEIEAWAKHIGCAELEATARPGFRKAARLRGFKEIQVIFRRALDG